MPPPDGTRLHSEPSTGTPTTGGDTGPRAAAPDTGDPADATRRPTSPATIPAEVWRVAAVVVFGAFMASLDTSLVNVGLDTIGKQLHTPLRSVQWVSSSYLLALAAALPLCGWLGRRVGTGRLWLWALAAFTVTSGLCAVAPNISVLIALRVAQGVAGGLLVPTGQTLVGQAAGPGRMGRVMNTSGIAVVLAPALGPTIGGLLIAHLSWHWLFLINLPVGAVALLLGLRILPHGQSATAGVLDLPGLLIVSSGLPLLSYGIISASAAHTVLSAPALVGLLVGIAALGAFVRRALRQRAPLLDLRLFGNRTYAAAELSVFFTGAALFGGMIILPLYFELLRGMTVVQTGLLLLAYGAGAALAMRTGGQLTDRIGGGLTSLLGLSLTVVTTVPFVVLSGHAPLVGVEVLLFLRGAGLGLSGLPAMSAAYATVDREQLPDATAQSNVLQRVGGALGSALFVTVLDSHATSAEAGFHTTFGWLTATAAAALIAAGWLAVEERGPRRQSQP